MYESWFGLSERPFRMVPHADRFFESGDIQNAYELVNSCVQSGAGPALIVGPTGVGKTTLALRIKGHFDRKMTAAMVSGPTCYSRRAVLQNTLTQFGMPFSKSEDNELRLNLHEYFNSRSKGCVLIIDDAGMLNDEAFEEVRFLSNLTCNGRWCVHLVLLGSMRLEDKMSTPAIESLNQRIATRCYLGPWTRSETTEFVDYELRAAGYKGRPFFEESAFAELQKISGGVPRIVNQLANHAMVMAAGQQAKTIDGMLVEVAWADLQKLPAPVRHSKVADPDVMTSDIVEFGSLDDMESSVSVDSNQLSDAHPVAAEDQQDVQPADDAQSDMGYAPKAQRLDEFAQEFKGHKIDHDVLTHQPSINPMDNFPSPAPDADSPFLAPFAVEEHTALDAVDSMVSTAAQAEIAAGIGTTAGSPHPGGNGIQGPDDAAKEPSIDWAENARLDEQMDIKAASAVAMAAVAGGITSTPIASSLINRKSDGSPGDSFHDFAAPQDPAVFAENLAAAKAQISPEFAHEEPATEPPEISPEEISYESESDISEIEQTIVELHDETRDFTEPEVNDDLSVSDDQSAGYESGFDGEMDDFVAENPFLEQFDEEEVVFGRPEGLQQNSDVIGCEVNTASGQNIIQRLDVSDQECQSECQSSQSECHSSQSECQTEYQEECGETEYQEGCGETESTELCEVDQPVTEFCEDAGEQQQEEYQLAELPDDELAEDYSNEVLTFEEQTCEQQNDEPCCEGQSCEPSGEQVLLESNEATFDTDPFQATFVPDAPDEFDSACPAGPEVEAACSTNDCSASDIVESEGQESQGVVICGGNSPDTPQYEPAPYESGEMPDLAGGPDSFQLAVSAPFVGSESGCEVNEDAANDPYVKDNSYAAATEPSGERKRKRLSRLFSGMRKKNQ